MEILTINSWNKERMTVAQINNEIIVDLEDEQYREFSPLAFEETNQMKSSITRDKNIDNIGILSDSISGSYGREYFNKYYMDEKGEMPSILNRLSFIGTDGLGALEFEPSEDVENKEDITLSLKSFKQLSHDIYNGDNSHRLATLVAKSNSGAGGAKAKAIVQYNPDKKDIHLSRINGTKLNGYVKVIMKFNNSSEAQDIKRDNDELKMEYIYYLLAKKSGVNISDSWLEVDDENNYYFITKRFDVDNEDNRFHMHSLAGILSHDASSFTLGYESLFRVGMMLNVSKSDKEQMFKTMVFNIVFANRDDHSRNFSFLMDSDYNWQYSPAYDLTYSRLNAWHQLTIDNKPTHQVRSLAIINIAKICSVDKPLDIISHMIEIKHKELHNLAKKYNIEDMAKDILKDTQDVDKMFRKRL